MKKALMIFLIISVLNANTVEYNFTEACREFNIKKLKEIESQLTREQKYYLALMKEKIKKYAQKLVNEDVPCDDVKDSEPLTLLQSDVDNIEVINFSNFMKDYFQITLPKNNKINRDIKKYFKRFLHTQKMLNLFDDNRPLFIFDDDSLDYLLPEGFNLNGTTLLHMMGQNNPKLFKIVYSSEFFEGNNIEVMRNTKGKLPTDSKNMVMNNLFKDLGLPYRPQTWREKIKAFIARRKIVPLYRE